jgi:F-type H+-transporting ATPase subunit epsilon
MHLEVLTPQKVVVDAEVDEVTVPGITGDIGVLPQHTPLVTPLKPGTLSYRGKGGVGSLTIGAGYVEISGTDKILVLTQSADKASSADKA